MLSSRANHSAGWSRRIVRVEKLKSALRTYNEIVRKRGRKGRREEGGREMNVTCDLKYPG